MSNIKVIYDILTEIKNEPSKNGKQDILDKYGDNELLKEVMKFLFDDLIVTGLSKKKIEKVIKPVKTEVQLHTLEDMLEYLKLYNSGKQRDIYVVQEFIQSCAEGFGDEVADMIKGIAIKDYPIGISKVTLNKVYGKNFIFKFDVRKGSKFEGGLKRGKEYAVSIKQDGIRSIILVDDTGIKVYGRSGKEIKGLQLIEDTAWAMYEKTRLPMMYDGELLAFNPDRLSSEELFKVTSGKVRKDGIKKDIKFIMFDCMPLDEFKEGKSKLKWKDRRKEVEYQVYGLQGLSADFTLDGERIFDKVDILYKGNDINEINRVQAEVEALGYEGTMLDETDAYYEAKRTKSLLKYKTFHTVDLRVLRVEEHTRGNKLGSIVVDYKGYELGVGSGFSDKDREYYWNNQDEIVGKIVEISYFEESSNDKGTESLRFPVFKIVRDKDEVSYD